MDERAKTKPGLKYGLLPSKNRRLGGHLVFFCMYLSGPFSNQVFEGLAFGSLLNIHISHHFLTSTF